MMLTELMRSFIENPTTRANILAQVRHGLTYAGGILGGAVLAFLLKNGVDNTTAASVAQGLVGIIVSLGMWATSAFFSHADVQKVDAQLAAAAQLAPGTPTATIQALQNGKF